jgi:hypothetical protein
VVVCVVETRARARGGTAHRDTALFFGCADVDAIYTISVRRAGPWEKISHGEPTFFVKKRSFAMCASADSKATHTTQDLPVVGVYLNRRPNWSDVADGARR